MKRSLLVQFMGTAIIAFVVGIVIGGYLIPSQGPMFGGYPLRTTLEPRTTTRETSSTSSRSTSTGTPYVPDWSKTCQITVSSAGGPWPNNATTRPPLIYYIDVDKALARKGQLAGGIIVKVTPSGFGAENTIQMNAPPNVGGFQFLFDTLPAPGPPVNLQPTVSLQERDGPRTLWILLSSGKDFQSGLSSIPNGRYTAYIRGSITGPELPPGVANELCQPTQLIVDVYDSGGS